MSMLVNAGPGASVAGLVAEMRAGGMRHVLSHRLREAERLGLRVRVLWVTLPQLEQWVMETNLGPARIPSNPPDGHDWVHRGVPVRVRA